MQNVELSFMDGKFWRPSDPKEEEPAGVRLQWTFGLHSWEAVEVADSKPEPEPVVHIDKGRLTFGRSWVRLVSGSLTKEKTACRQRGQAIEPGGPRFTVEMLPVEHKYSAHLVQNS